jgi:hypothetical protein
LGGTNSMNHDVIEQQLGTSLTRRKVVATGTKLAYAVPLVAASFKLSNGAGAQEHPSAQCIPGTCEVVSVCGPRCGCRTAAGGITVCLKNVSCRTAAKCTSSDTCATNEVCLLTDCCGDTSGHCVPKCPAASAGLFAQSAAADEADGYGPGPWVLGPN